MSTTGTTAQATSAPAAARAAFDRDKPGTVRLRTLVLIRWLAVAGQALTVLIVHFVVGVSLPLGLLGIGIAVSALGNGYLSLPRYRGRRLGAREAVLHLAFDLVQLGWLLFLTGGLENPFVVLILAPVTISATVLSGRSTIALAALALAVLTVIALYARPLIWIDGVFLLPPLYIAGIWSALAIGTVFVSSYAWRVAREARHMSGALAATQLALENERRLSELGGLAAAAAHELGTPLGTISLIAHELEKSFPGDSELASDIALLGSQARRCREILESLSDRPSADDDSPYSRIPLTALVAEAARPHRDYGIRLIEERQPGSDDEPTVRRSPEIIHGLGNLIENAVGYATSLVCVTSCWRDGEIIVTVGDDGPGFAADILARLGEPYVTSRSLSPDGDDGGQGLGLGFFIAKTLLERTGADIRVANAADGGAEIVIVWPADRLSP